MLLESRGEWFPRCTRFSDLLASGKNSCSACGNYPLKGRSFAASALYFLPFPPPHPVQFPGKRSEEGYDIIHQFVVGIRFEGATLSIHAFNYPATFQNCPLIRQYLADDVGTEPCQSIRVSDHHLVDPAGHHFS